MTTLDGRVAVVTGGNGGLGYGFAEALLDAGAAVEIWGRNEEKTAAALQKLARPGRPARDGPSLRRRPSRRTSSARSPRPWTSTSASTRWLRTPAPVGSCRSSTRRSTSGVTVTAPDLDGVFLSFREAGAPHEGARRRRARRDLVDLGVARHAAARGVRREQGRDPRARAQRRGRARSLRHPRECAPPRLDRDRHASGDARQRALRRGHDRAHAGETMGHARRPRGARSCSSPTRRHRSTPATRSSSTAATRSSRRPETS